MLDWTKISPEDFESICYEFLKTKYSSLEINKNPVAEEIKKTAQTHDGGRDIEVQYTVMGHETRIWAECKKYKNKIDLNTLGKHLVLVYNNNIHKFIVFSASEIHENSEVAMVRFLKRLNIGIEIYSGDSLINELTKYPKVLRLCNIPSLEVSQTKRIQKYSANVRLDEYDGKFKNTLLKPYRLRKDGSFRISVVIRNHHAVDMNIVSTSFADGYDLDISSEILDGPVVLGPNSVSVFDFAFRVRNFRKLVQLPPLILKYSLGNNENLISGSVELGAVDLSHIHMSPLVGEDRKKIINNAKKILADTKESNISAFFDIRGKGGTGKTRLLKEIVSGARQIGLKVVTADCRSDSSNLIKKIISSLCKIPFGKGDLTFSFNKLGQYFEQRGLAKEHYDNLISFFESSKLNETTLYSLSETVKYLLENNNKSVLIAIDNFQDVNVEFISLFTNIVEHFSQHEAHVAILFSTNTEIVKSESKVHIDAFLQNIESLFPPEISFHHLSLLSELTTEDAKIFILNKICGLHDKDQLLETLIKKAGKRPYDLEMTIAYLRDTKKLLEGSDGVFWAIKDIDKFREFLADLPQGIGRILKRRFNLLHESSSENEWAAYEQIFKILLLFQGEVPLSALDYLNIDRYYFNKLIKKSFLRYGAHTENYVAYHDNLLLSMDKNGKFSPDVNIARQMLDFFETPYSQMIPNRKLVKFFCSYHASLFDKILENGTDAIYYYKGLNDHQNIYKVGRLLTKIFEQQNYGNKNPQEFVNIYTHYLRSASRYANYAYAIEKLEELVNFMHVNSKKIDKETYHSLMHQFVNIHMNTGGAPMALKLLEQIESRGITIPTYKFLLLNRYCVAHTFLGNLEQGQRYAEEALQEAYKLNNYECLSVAYSDYGHMHLNLTKDIDAAIKMFNHGIDIVENIENEKDFRQIEIRQQSAFCDFLTGAYDDALVNIENALSVAKTMNYVYFEIKISVLKAACLIRLKNPNAEETLIRAKNLCEIFANDRFRWRVLAMLGTAYLIDEKNQAGMESLDLAMELYSKFDKGGVLLTKELPWISNALIGSVLGNDTLKQKIILERFPAPELLQMARMMNSMDKAEIKNARFPMVGIASHGPYSLLLS
ncbi:restriction endonuclease [Maridesulfovibrio sp.]|uniref:restriction endonuclease n=1 Tax=Maridesulfovibrio sp. TaxID=2795000 RepID=UPI0029CA21D4|nr:restriction endonuclease [Maridesulfovibrio sp.]